jgi:hypothetical protein
MRLEIADHMRRGAEVTERFLRSLPDEPRQKSNGVTKKEDMR